MKLFFKKYKFYLIPYIILLLILTITFINHNNWYNKHIESINEIINECKSENISIERKEYCENIIKNANTNKDYYYTVSELESGLNKVYPFIFIFISFPVLYYVCNMFKSRVVNYELTRQNYKTFRKKLLMNSYKSSLLMIIIYLTIVITSYIYCNGFIASTEYIPNNVSNPYTFILINLFKILVLNLTYVNISLIVARQNHKLYISLILSLLLFYGIELLSGYFIGTLLLDKIFDLNISSNISIYNLFVSDLTNPLVHIIYPLFMFIVTIFIMNYMYKSKEKLVIDCDKNN